MGCLDNAAIDLVSDASTDCSGAGASAEAADIAPAYVLWAPSGRLVESVDEPALRRALLVRGGVDAGKLQLLDAEAIAKLTYTEELEAEAGPRVASLLDLSVRFGHVHLAQELAARGAKALLPASVAVNLRRHCGNFALGAVVRAAHAVGLASPECADVLWATPDDCCWTLLDAAICAGIPVAAESLCAHGVPLRAALPGMHLDLECFLVDLPEQAATEAPSDALTFHFGKVLRTEAVDSALCAGVQVSQLSGLCGDHPYKRKRLSLLDAVILSGAREKAQARRLRALISVGAESVLGTCLLDYVFGETSFGHCCLFGDTVRAAMLAGLGIERGTVSVMQITFSYPMKKTVQAFTLLDVAVCLGKRRLAQEIASRTGQELVVQGTLRSVLEETHLFETPSITMFPLSLWGSGMQASFPKKTLSVRMSAAATAAQVLDKIRMKARMDYVILLAQWKKLWFRDSDGLIHLRQQEMLMKIYSYALPSVLLTGPRLYKALAKLRDNGQLQESDYQAMPSLVCSHS